MQVGLGNISNKIELEMKERCKNGKIELIKSELIEKIEILQGNFDNKIDEIELTNKGGIKLIKDEIRLEMMKVCKQTIDKSIMQMGIKEKINKLERNVENKMKGIFEIMIDNVDDLKNKYEYIWSEYFYTRNRPYKLQLCIYYRFGDQLWIDLNIFDDVINQYLSFPFTADVTIKIINKKQREVSKSLKKYCKIKKPQNNSSKVSDPFIYSISELTEIGILESNSFIVECCVELK